MKKSRFTEEHRVCPGAVGVRTAIDEFTGRLGVPEQTFYYLWKKKFAALAARRLHVMLSEAVPE